MKYRSSILRYALLSSSFFLFSMNFWPNRKYIPASAPVSEDFFDPVLAMNLQSVNDLLTYTDSIAQSKNITAESTRYWNEMARVLRYRFYHGYSYYTPATNWLAFITGKLIWDHLHAIVIPDEIMKYPMAACSQQSIVMMECMKRKDIPYRSVEFAHHYAIEGKIKGRWKFFDTNMEPSLPAGKRRSLAYYYKNDQLEKMYAHKLDADELAYTMDFQRYGVESAPPAPNATLFHQLTFICSRILWIFPLIIFAYIKQTDKKPQHHSLKS